MRGAYYRDQTERPDYLYLKSVFRELRAELELAIPHKEVRLPELLIKTLFYTGVRVSELVAIRLDEVDVERCQLRITQGKGSKDRLVPLPHAFRELLALYIEQMRKR